MSAPDRAAFARRVWPDMLALYARDGVPALCLELQDGAGIDLPLLLVLILADRDAIGATPAELAALIDGSAFWRDSVIRPIRAVRRALKAAGDDPEFREAVRQLELEAERRHVERLAVALTATAGTAPALAPAYLAACGLGAAEVTAAADALRAAADTRTMEA